MEKTARQREELNALYVAMTRARNRLVLSSVGRTPSARTAGGSGCKRCAPIECLGLRRLADARSGQRFLLRNFQAF